MLHSLTIRCIYPQLEVHIRIYIYIYYIHIYIYLLYTYIYISVYFFQNTPKDSSFLFLKFLDLCAI